MKESDQQQTATLLLEDGTLFEGLALGKRGLAFGEICFDTSMTGYQEVLTDPAFRGQILIMNNIYIGNYGMYEKEAVSDRIQVNGLVCKNVPEIYSRKFAENSLEESLVKDGIVGIYDLDTRALVTHIRDKGAMRGVISSEGLAVEELGKKLKEWKVEEQDLVTEVSTGTAYERGEGEKKVAVLDLGVKRNTLEALVKRGAKLKVFPAKSDFSEIEAFQPQAYFISDGPGDPHALKDVLPAVQKMINSGKPVFGVSLGHELIALANDMKVNKMHHGRRGANHPVLNQISNQSEITSQNHGFELDVEDAKNNPGVVITHTNLNDGSVEGIRLKDKEVASVQFNPNGQDSQYLFDDFIASIK